MQNWATCARRRHDEATQRRVKVAELFARGEPQRAIAEQLGVSQGVVTYDIKALKAQWREASFFEMNEYIGSELLRLDYMQKVAWQEFDKSGVEKIVRTTSGGAESKQETFLPKDIRFLKFLYDVIVLRSKLMGVVNADYCNLNKPIETSSDGATEVAKAAIAEMSTFIKTNGFAYGEKEIEEALTTES